MGYLLNDLGEILTTDAGEFLTDQIIGSAARSIACNCGHYNLSGQPDVMSTTQNFEMLAAFGNYAVSGQPINNFTFGDRFVHFKYRKRR